MLDKKGGEPKKSKKKRQEMAKSGDTYPNVRGKGHAPNGIQTRKNTEKVKKSKEKILKNA